MLDEVKGYLMLMSNHFDNQLQALIDTAIADLVMAGITNPGTHYGNLAVKVFVKAHFGERNDNAELLETYEFLKKRLAVCSQAEEAADGEN